MPVSKKRVDPKVARNYYLSRGNARNDGEFMKSIARTAEKARKRLNDRRDSIVSLMVSGGLCKSLNRA